MSKLLWNVLKISVGGKCPKCPPDCAPGTVCHSYLLAVNVRGTKLQTVLRMLQYTFFNFLIQTKLLSAKNSHLIALLCIFL